MINGWQIRLNLGACDSIFEESVAEQDIPFLPHVGDAFWLSDTAEEKLDTIAKECWIKNKCKNCPYAYGWQKSVDDVSVGDYIFVESIIHKVEKKEVLITLCDGTKRED